LTKLVAINLQLGCGMCLLRSITLELLMIPLGGADPKASQWSLDLHNMFLQSGILGGDGSFPLVVVWRSNRHMDRKAVSRVQIVRNVRDTFNTKLAVVFWMCDINTDNVRMLLGAIFTVCPWYCEL
jgi:hypothetical protein